MADKLKLMRGASYLLPDPGGEVVRDLIDQIEQLQAELDELRRWKADIESQGPVAWATPSGTVASAKEKAANAARAPAHTLTIPLYAHPMPSVPARLTPDGKYGKQHHYAEGWNDCIDAILTSKEES